MISDNLANVEEKGNYAVNEVHYVVSEDRCWPYSFFSHKLLYITRQ